ncbi:nudix hydrolase [Stylonychia lemnae]|uniref:Nudix hydrolase n=1 Tax=Stylonychia lemnae TaxID=5949 RepID=A0A078ALE1_STYLE|nr:nudix hydrolase [Stylonychia lemnae]|eukprot:CDW82227.1 nudix hydrolase [Stylonychia lemnae]
MQSEVNIQQTSLSAEEIVLIVDENNVPIGRATRREVREKNLWHRASYIFVYNSKGQFYVQKRSIRKDYCPGYFDLANGGVMGADETDIENAQRELEEEIGLKDVELKLLFNCKYRDAGNGVWGNVFGVQYDIDLKDMKLQEEEVEYIVLLTREEILSKIQEGEKFTPDSIMAFKQFIELEEIKEYLDKAYSQ